MSQQYAAMITDMGKSLIAEALAKGEKLNITKAAVGDGGGAYYMPVPEMAELKGETWSGDVHSVTIGESSSTIEVIAVVPSHVGGFTIREMAIFTDNKDLFAICNTPDTEKVVITSGAIGEMEIMMRLEVSNTDAITFVVDTNVIAATKRDLENHDKSAKAHKNLFEPTTEKIEQNITAIELLGEGLSEIRNEIKTKVDKEQGKGLSTNDFTSAYKQQVDANEQEISALQRDKEPLIKNAPIKASMVDADTMPLSDSIATSTTKKITFANLKTSLKGYFDTLYNRYTHPTYSSRSSGLYKVTVDGSGHVNMVSAVTKPDITALGIPSQDTIVPLSNSVDSTSTTTAATSYAVKQVNDALLNAPFTGSYLAFCGSTNTDMLEAAFGKGNEEHISLIGKQLAMYGWFKGEWQAFTELAKCRSLRDCTERAFREIRAAYHIDMLMKDVPYAAETVKWHVPLPGDIPCSCSGQGIAYGGYQNGGSNNIFVSSVCVPVTGFYRVKFLVAAITQYQYGDVSPRSYVLYLIRNGVNSVLAVTDGSYSADVFLVQGDALHLYLTGAIDGNALRMHSPVFLCTRRPLSLPSTVGPGTRIVKMAGPGTVRDVSSWANVGDAIVIDTPGTYFVRSVFRVVSTNANSLTVTIALCVNDVAVHTISAEAINYYNPGTINPFEATVTVYPGNVLQFKALRDRSGNYNAEVGHPGFLIACDANDGFPV